jgi:hypothetical protein
LFDTVRRHEDRSAAELTADGALLDLAGRLRARYEDDAWTWRR